MKKFSIPVTWQVWDKVEVEVETIEEAIKYVKNNIDEIPLGTEPEYMVLIKLMMVKMVKNPSKKLLNI